MTKKKTLEVRNKIIDVCDSRQPHVWTELIWAWQLYPQHKQATITAAKTIKRKKKCTWAF